MPGQTAGGKTDAQTFSILAKSHVVGFRHRSDCCCIDYSGFCNHRLEAFISIPPVVILFISPQATVPHGIPTFPFFGPISHQECIRVYSGILITVDKTVYRVYDKILTHKRNTSSLPGLFILYSGITG